MPRYWRQVAGFISADKMAQIEAKVTAWQIGRVPLRLPLDK
jgi:hypothetical protein